MMILCGAASFAQEAMPRFEIPTARSSGMGGTHTAYTDNVFALLVNPAAIMRVEQRSFFALSPTLFSPESTFNLIGPFMDVARGNLSALGSAADTLSKKNGKVPLGFDIREFPLSVAWVADGFGFGLWNRVFVNPSIIGTNVVLDAYADVILPVGFAFKILETDSHTLDLGVTVKPFVRVRAHESVSITDLMDNADFVDDISVPLIAGAGVDMGLLYRWDMGLQAGLTFNDIFTRGAAAGTIVGKKTSDYYYVPFSMDIGLAYDFPLGKYWTTAPGFLGKTTFTLAADYRDLFNIFQQDDYSKRNAALGLGIGFQIAVFDMFKFRMGMNEMLPAVGLGFDLGIFEIDAAYYGREFGLEPGQLSAAALDLTIAIRPDAKKRTWPWTQGSVVGLFTGKKEK
jgi:hypothetical protein